MSRCHHLCFFILDRFQPLDLFGPLEAFATAESFASGRYRWTLSSFEAGLLKTESGVPIQVDTPIDRVQGIDTLIFVGGGGPRQTILTQPQIDLLQHLADDCERVASVCTGTFLLAQLPTSTGRRLSTHWRHAQTLRNACPDIDVEENALFLNDDRVWSSAGVVSGIDMAMAMIAEDYGGTVAASVARQLVVYARRSGHQSQFSEPLLAQSQHSGRMAEILTWIADHPNDALSVEALAQRAGMSLRHFTRTFTKKLGMPPAKYVERVRLDHARMMLSAGDGRVSEIAASVGFNSPDTFRRAFERQFGISPTDYRQQFPTIQE